LQGQASFAHAARAREGDETDVWAP